MTCTFLSIQALVAGHREAEAEDGMVSDGEAEDGAAHDIKDKGEEKEVWEQAGTGEVEDENGTYDRRG